MVLVWFRFRCGLDSEVLQTSAIESRTEPLNDEAGVGVLFLEESIGGDGDGHFPRFGVNEIRQRENHAIDDSADHGDDRQKAEQAGHQQASGGELTIEIMGMAEPDYQHVRLAVARVSGNGIGGGSIGGAERCDPAATELFDA
jgi:hypothetical protein